MNLETLYTKQQNAKAKAQLENVRFQGEISLKQVQSTSTDMTKKGFKLSAVSVWASADEIDQNLIDNTVRLAKEVGIANPIWSKRAVDCVDKRTGETFVREVLRVKAGLSFTF